METNNNTANEGHNMDRKLFTEYMTIANNQEAGRELMTFTERADVLNIDGMVNQLKADKSTMRRKMRSQATEIEALRLALRAAGLDY